MNSRKRKKGEVLLKAADDPDNNDRKLLEQAKEKKRKIQFDELLRKNEENERYRCENDIIYCILSYQYGEEKRKAFAKDALDIIIRTLGQNKEHGLGIYGISDADEKEFVNWYENGSYFHHCVLFFVALAVIDNFRNYFLMGVPQDGLPPPPHPSIYGDFPNTSLTKFLLKTVPDAFDDAIFGRLRAIPPLTGFFAQVAGNYIAECGVPVPNYRQQLEESNRYWANMKQNKK